MEPLKKEKRVTAELIPYKRTEEGFMFYLQKRDNRAERFPGMVSMFGGGRENGESITENLMREINEELKYVPEQAVYFSYYESASGTYDIFIEEVGEDFEANVTVQEGECGIFMTNAQVQHDENVTPLTKLIISQVAEYLEK